MRIFLALFFMMAAILPVSAQEPAQDNATPWQAAVSGQIEALRDGDAALALSFAGEGFRTQFEGKPQEFYAAILALGYTPIAESRSHSFGEFTRIGDEGVVQVVKFIGADQSLYEAVYQLGNEGDGGWHVLGVVLKKAAGMAV